MKVRELIEELQKIEDKELDVVTLSQYDGYTTELEIDRSSVYYGKVESTGWTVKTRDCIIIE